MSTITDALEAEVAAIRAVRGQTGETMTPRARLTVDRHFARLMQLIAPRVRHFTRAYGLLDHADDAAQACAIGLHRAIEAYDPARARFTTFVNWQLRGELQALRFRLRTDSRDWAVKAGATTVSLDALGGEEGSVILPEDTEALERTEALAAETMARRACGTLLDEHYGQMRRMALREGQRRADLKEGRRRAAPRGRECVKPGTIPPQELDRIEARIRLERDIVTAHLLGEGEAPQDCPLSAEQRRQVARRTLRALTDRARGNPRFDPEALGLEELASTRRH